MKNKKILITIASIVYFLLFIVFFAFQPVLSDIFYKFFNMSGTALGVVSALVIPVYALASAGLLCYNTVELLSHGKIRKIPFIIQTVMICVPALIFLTCFISLLPH